MRKAPLLAALAALLAAASSVGATEEQPRLRVADRAPLTVAGRGFDAQESVRVRLAAKGRTWTRRASSTATGTFRMRFTVSLGRCDSISLQAFGSAGSRARLFATAPRLTCNPDE